MYSTRTTLIPYADKPLFGLSARYVLCIATGKMPKEKSKVLTTMTQILAPSESTGLENGPGAADNLDFSIEEDPQEEASRSLGRGTCRKTANTRYKDFGMH